MDDACSMLLGAMQRSIRETLGEPNGGGNPVGVAFSGGVDSTLLAVVCDAMGYDTVLLTVGFVHSHDAGFAARVASRLPMPHYTLAITDVQAFAARYDMVRKAVPCNNLSWVENSVAFYYISSLARDLRVDAVATANGIDELFCGYDAYRRAYVGGAGPPHDGGGNDDAMCGLMRQKLQNELDMMSDAVGVVASALGVTLLQPLLRGVFSDAAYRIPLYEKITGPDDMRRKHIIRRLAREVGVPHMSCEKRKKALQYGSGIHKAVLRIRRCPAAHAHLPSPSSCPPRAPRP